MNDTETFMHLNDISVSMALLASLSHSLHLPPKLPCIFRFHTLALLTVERRDKPLKTLLNPFLLSLRTKTDKLPVRNLLLFVFFFQHPTAFSSAGCVLIYESLSQYQASRQLLNNPSLILQLARNLIEDRMVIFYRSE
jgi:hypothetical protein